MSTPPRKTLWAPWRIDFMRELAQGPPGESAGRPTCFFCTCTDPHASEEQLADEHVLYRNAHGVLMMNRYPYVNGHLLVAPAQHVTDLTDLTPEGLQNVMALIALGAKSLKAALDCQGYNVGFNIGKCAGAAVPGHVHAHIVPRWHGDTNFMEMIGGVKIIPQALEDCFADLKRKVNGLVA